MPVLPVVHTSQPSVDNTTRPADAGAAQDSSPAFSNVLSGQRNTTADDQSPTRRVDVPSSDAAKKQDPLGPDETLALILDSAALPLMQPLVQTPATLRHQTGAASPKTDAITGDQPAPQRGQAVAALLADDSAAADTPQPGQKAQGDTAPLTVRATQPILTPTAPTRLQAAAVDLPQADKRTPVTNRPVTALSASADTTVTSPASLASATATHTAVATQLSSAPALLTDTPVAALGASLLPAATSSSIQPAIQLAVPTPLNSPQWPQDFSRQILNLTQAGASGHTVQMRVNPPELGPIHITLHLGDTLAQASFISPHANVRQALENALPHLEQQLAQAGLSLGQANVSDQQPGQQAFGQSAQGSGSSDGATFSLDGGTNTVASDANPAASAPRPLIRPDALVDTFV
ncbi:MAG: flagellar hook-length control protein FliK [Castellaniella sp.]|uniref:flagellar hook-length control protein FliK n=1 Tax=Castellaniella sp. TaxID=1955812 RepID=UPI003C77C21A